MGAGHGPGGLPYGQKSLVAPATHLLLAESISLRAGLPDRGLWSLLLPTLQHAWSDPASGGHGALGYNASHKDLQEFWSRTGLFSLAATLRGERPDMATAMARIQSQRFPWFRNSHAYGEPGGAWGLVSLSVVDREAFTSILSALR